MSTKSNPTRHVPARDLSIPASVSAAARALMSIVRPSFPSYPPVEQHEEWRARIANTDSFLLPLTQQRGAVVSAKTGEIKAGDVPIYTVTPEGTDPNGPIVLDIHGGALISGGGEVCRAWAKVIAGELRSNVWAVDYRMPPDHPYPAGLDDCIASYRALLAVRRPEEIIVEGLSAGANLAGALVLRARDEGLPLPAGLLLLTPEIDLTESGDTFQTNLGVDSALGGSLMNANLLYAAGHDLADPYLSPLFGDFSKGFPPTFLSAGTRDLFLSNAVRMHSALRAAGVAAQLHIIEAASHGGFPGSPEDEALYADARAFMSAVVGPKHLFIK